MKIVQVPFKDYYHEESPQNASLPTPHGWNWNRR
jgi:hypothetical protein